MAQSRYYTSTAQPTVLLSSITPSSTVINVQAVTGFPLSFPYVLALDYGNSAEELVLVTSAVGTSLTVTRAFDGTSGAAHNAGAAVRHTWCGADGNDSRLHEASVAAVHGVAGTIVGTTDVQTLTNKTLTNPTINGGTLSGSFVGSPQFALINLRNTPAATTVQSVRVTGDANDRFAVQADGVNLWGSGSATPDVTLSRTGAATLGLASTNQLNLLNTTAVTSASTGNALQIGTTAAVNLRIGNSAIQAANNAVASTLSLNPSGSNVATFVLNAGAGSTSQFINNGQLLVQSPNTSAINQLQVNAPSGASASQLLLSLQNNASLRFSVSATGQASIVKTGNTAGVPLSVIAEAGQTGDLINVQVAATPTFRVDNAGNIPTVGSVTSSGNISATGTGSFQVETTTTGLTASTGWSVVTFSARRTAGIATIRCTLQRTGANIVATSTGNIVETDICIVPAGWRPGVASFHTIFVNAGTSDGDCVIDGSTGQATLSTLSPTATIATNDNVTFTATYVL